MRKGYWVILDELNLAPTDVLEALNRVGVGMTCMHGFYYNVLLCRFWMIIVNCLSLRQESW